MTAILKLVSLLGLVLTVVPAFLVLYGTMEWRTHSHLMLLGLVLWFGTAPLWMKGK
jgi:hypothetical protein